MSDPTVSAFLTKLLCSHGGRLPKDELAGHLALAPGQLEQILAEEAQRFPQVAGLVLAQSPVRICTRYLKSEAEEEEECGRLHLCRYHLQGKCWPGKRPPCKFSHNILTDHNQKVLKANEISGLNDPELRVLLLQNDHQLLPEVCVKYLKDSCDQGSGCSRLHVCGYFTRGECNRRTCKRSHNLLNTSEELLQRCRISPDTIQNFQMLCEQKHRDRLRAQWAEPSAGPRTPGHVGRRGRGRGRSKSQDPRKRNEEGQKDGGGEARGRSTSRPMSERHPYGSGEDDDEPKTELEKLMSDWFIAEPAAAIQAGPPASYSSTYRMSRTPATPAQPITVTPAPPVRASASVAPKPSLPALPTARVKPTSSTATRGSTEQLRPTGFQRPDAVTGTPTMGPTGPTGTYDSGFSSSIFSSSTTYPGVKPVPPPRPGLHPAPAKNPLGVQPGSDPRSIKLSEDPLSPASVQPKPLPGNIPQPPRTPAPQPPPAPPPSPAPQRPAAPQPPPSPAPQPPAAPPPSPAPQRPAAPPPSPAPQRPAAPPPSPAPQPPPAPPPSPAPQRPLNPAPVSTTDTKSDQTPELCLSNIWKFCKLGGKCPDMHFYLPYRWQIFNGKDWADMQDMESVEKAFCDPATTRIPLVNFETMRCGSSPVRRLSTPSSVTRPPEYVLTTEWVWYWKDEFGKWTAYGQANTKNVSSTILSSDLESIYLSDPQGSVPFTAGQQQYELNFREMKQKNVVYRTGKDVSRRPRFLSFDDVKMLKGSTKSSSTNSTHRSPSSPLRTGLYPQEWDPSALPEMHHQKVAVVKASGEYADLVRMFAETLSGQAVERIWRIQNPSLWQIYQWQKEQMKKANKGAEVAERRLFHGTDHAHTDAICNDNFDWRICGTHGTVYGQGSYFARDASYSHHYSPPDGAGRRRMFLARVLVGEYAAGTSAMKRPPPKPRGDRSYDTCVDDIGNPSIYVVFDKLQIYPEYILEYSEDKKCAVS